VASTNPVSFNKRTFSEYVDSTINLIREKYPEVYRDFTDSSVGTMLIEVNAGVANNLSQNLDRVFQETQLQYAQQKANILSIAKNLGFNIPAKRASVTVVDFSVQVPVRGDSPNPEYYPVIGPGCQVVGGGKIFETADVIDFSSSFSSLGDSNRSTVPNFDANGVIQSYTITKREVVLNGSTSIFKKVIREAESRPFYELLLPDNDVIEITSAILLTGTNYAGNPPEEEFLNPDNRFYEVDYLAQQRVFVDDPNAGNTPANTGGTGIKAGKYIEIKRKFIKEFTTNGFCKLTFGGGNGQLDLFLDGFAKAGITNQAFLNNYLNNTSLGERLTPDNTLFIKYRTGGGSASNIGSNVLNGIGSIPITVNGPREDLNKQVRRSLKVNNPIPAIGGNDGLSIEQIRYLCKYNSSSQYRDVSINDYLFQVFKMPGKYGSPYRATAFKQDNKVVISILGIGADGKLNNTSNSLLKENIAEYLTEFREVNDYVEVRDGKIIDLAFTIDVYISDSVNQSELANRIIRTVSDYFAISNSQMNEDIFLGDLQNQINDIDGVFNILSVKVYNKVGNGYSLNEISQAYVSETTREIKLQNNTVYSGTDSMFQIRFPEKDIKLLLRKKTDLKV
jgi:hypothetical protein